MRSLGYSVFVQLIGGLVHVRAPVWRRPLSAVTEFAVMAVVYSAVLGRQGVLARHRTVRNWLAHRIVQHDEALVD